MDDPRLRCRATTVTVLTVLALSVILFPPFRSDAQSPDDRYPFVRDGKVGFIDSRGREVIAPQFSNAGDTAHFQDGLAPVFKAGEGSGYIAASGRFAIGPSQVWGWGRPFHEGLAGVLIWAKSGGANRPGWIDCKGNFVFSGMGAEGGYFSEGLMSMPRNGKWGFVDKYFQFVIEPKFDWAEEFSEGRAVVKIAEKWGYIDKLGKVVIAAKYDLAWGFSDGLARVRNDLPNGKVMTMEGEQNAYRYQYGFVDHDGKEVIPLRFEEATYFSEGFALAAPPNFKLLGVIDKRGNFVHGPEFDDAGEFHEGLARACVKQKCGYVDTGGVWVIPPSFTYAKDFWHGLAQVSWSDAENSYIDKTGKTIWKNTSTKGH